MLNGFSRHHADQIAAMRGTQPFTSIDDFSRRTHLSNAVLEQLAEADAFGTISPDRRAALWNVLGQDPRQNQRPLLLGLDDDEPEPDLPELSMQEQVFMDYLTTGLSLKSHPMAFFRAGLQQLRVTPAADLESLPNNRIVRVAGLVLLRQRPSTAKGITFVTLEDETGMVNLVVKQPIWERYYAVARRSCAWIAYGPMQCKDGVIHVVANRLEDLSAQLGNLTVHSRDFR
jgi:error-prone DNA polymerase